MAERLQWLEERRIIYSMFATLYRGELSNGLTFLRQTGLLQHLSEYFTCSKVRDEAGQLELELVEHRDDPIYGQELAREYNRLFVGPGPLAAPPWESVYLTKEKLLCGEPEAAVRRCYQSFGLAPDKGAEPADHLALELAFMSRLCALAISEPERLRELLAGQRRFLEEHLLAWTPAWADDVCSNSQTRFWRSLAALTQAWLADDLSEVARVHQLYKSNMA